MPKIGDRVGAIVGAEDGVVEFLGYGVYAGDFEPPAERREGTVGEQMRKDLGLPPRPNPRIDLDNGDTVWGCECWWGSEEKIRKSLEEYDEIVEVRMVNVRKRWAEGGDDQD